MCLHVGRVTIMIAPSSDRCCCSAAAAPSAGVRCSAAAVLCCSCRCCCPLSRLLSVAARSSRSLASSSRRIRPSSASSCATWSEHNADQPGRHDCLADWQPRAAGNQQYRTPQTTEALSADASLCAIRTSGKCGAATTTGSAARALSLEPQRRESDRSIDESRIPLLRDLRIALFADPSSVPVGPACVFCVVGRLRPLLSAI